MGSDVTGAGQLRHYLELPGLLPRLPGSYLKLSGLPGLLPRLPGNYTNYLEVIWIIWIVTGITWKLPGYA